MQGGVVLRPFSPEIKFVINLIRPAQRPVPLAVDEFLAHVADEQKDMEKRLKEILSEA